MVDFAAKRVSSRPAETPALLQKPAHLQKASVEQIWSSWRHEKQAPKSAEAAERLNQLKGIGEYETALQVALAEVRLEERGGRRTGERAIVPIGAHEARAAKFLERIDTARAAAAAHSEDNNS